MDDKRGVQIPAAVFAAPSDPSQGRVVEGHHGVGLPRLAVQCGGLPFTAGPHQLPFDRVAKGPLQMVINAKGIVL